MACSPLRPHDLCTVTAQAAQSAEQAAQRAAQAADERGTSVAEQERRIAAAQSELSAAQQRLQQQQAELEVTGAAVTMMLLQGETPPPGTVPSCTAGRFAGLSLEQPKQTPHHNSAMSCRIVHCRNAAARWRDWRRRLRKRAMTLRHAWRA